MVHGQSSAIPAARKRRGLLCAASHRAIPGGEQRDRIFHSRCEWLLCCGKAVADIAELQRTGGEQWFVTRIGGTPGTGKSNSIPYIVWLVYASYRSVFHGVVIRGFRDERLNFVVRWDRDGNIVAGVVMGDIHAIVSDFLFIYDTMPPAGMFQDRWSILVSAPGWTTNNVWHNIKGDKTRRCTVAPWKYEELQVLARLKGLTDEEDGWRYAYDVYGGVPRHVFAGPASDNDVHFRVLMTTIGITESVVADGQFVMDTARACPFLETMTRAMRGVEASFYESFQTWALTQWFSKGKLEASSVLVHIHAETVDFASTWVRNAVGLLFRNRLKRKLWDMVATEGEGLRYELWAHAELGLGGRFFVSRRLTNTQSQVLEGSEERRRMVDEGSKVDDEEGVGSRKGRRKRRRIVLGDTPAVEQLDDYKTMGTDAYRWLQLLVERQPEVREFSLGVRRRTVVFRSNEELKALLTSVGAEAAYFVPSSRQYPDIDSLALVRNDDSSLSLVLFQITVGHEHGMDTARVLDLIANLGYAGKAHVVFLYRYFFSNAGIDCEPVRLTSAIIFDLQRNGEHRFRAWFCDSNRPGCLACMSPVPCLLLMATCLHNSNLLVS